MTRYFLPAGESKYPTTPGNILRLKKKVQRYNPKVKEVVEHTVYIWILRRGTLRKRKGNKAKDQMFRWVRVFLPVDFQHRKSYIMSQSRGQHDTLCTYIRKNGGCEVISNNCKFRYKRREIAIFYRTIGLL